MVHQYSILLSSFKKIHHTIMDIYRTITYEKYTNCTEAERKQGAQVRWGESTENRRLYSSLALYTGNPKPRRAQPRRKRARAGSRGVIKAVIHQQARGNSGARAPGYDTVVYGAGSMPASSLPLALPPCISSPLVGG